MQDYIITKKEEENYSVNGIASSRIKAIWNDFLSNIPTNLRLEAMGKGFKLAQHPVGDLKSKETLSYNVMFVVDNASDKLEEYLNRSDKNIIICMRDEI